MICSKCNINQYRIQQQLVRQLLVGQVHRLRRNAVIAFGYKLALLADLLDKVVQRLLPRNLHKLVL